MSSEKNVICDKCCQEQLHQGQSDDLGNKIFPRKKWLQVIQEEPQTKSLKR